MDKNDLTGITFRDFIRPFFRQKLIIIITFIIVVPLTYLFIIFKTPMYAAKVMIHIKGISQIAAPTYEAVGPFRIHLTQMAIVKSNPVIKRAVKALGLESRPLDYEKKYCHPLKRYLVDYMANNERAHIASLSPVEKEEYLLWKAMSQLKDNIETRIETATDIFQIVVRDYDGTKAVEIANVVSRSYTIYDLQQQLAELTLKYGDLHPTVQQLQDNINKISTNLNGKEISDLDSIGSASVKIIEQASTDFKPVGKPRSMMMMLGLFVATLLGLALAFIVDMLNNTLKSPDDFVKYLDLPSLGTIPKKRIIDKLLISDAPEGSRYAEFYVDLADQIFIFMKVQNLKSLLFISVSPQAMNSVVCANIAFSLSKNSDINTLVVDANMNQPIIQKLLKLDERPGLANLLNENNINFDDAISTIGPNLHVMQTGNVSEGSTASLNKSKIKTILKKLTSKYDGVLIDCTNITRLPDITMLSSSVDGVILIANEGKDNVQSTKNILQALSIHNAKIMGGILNNRTFPIPGWIYRKI